MAKITAISSLGWSHYTLYEALPRMMKRGFTRVEIASFGTYCFHFNYGSPIPTELKEMLDAYGVIPICLNHFTTFHEAWRPEEIDVFVQEWTHKLRHMQEVGIPMMTMGFGVRNERDDQQEQLSHAVEAYNRVGDIAAKYGVRMLLEVPHLYSILHRPQQVLEVFDRLESKNVGALVDCSHWGILGYDLDAFLSALGDRLWHIHLRDSAGPDTADCQQALELTPGEGVVDFKAFGEALDRVGYDGDVSIEFEYRDMTLDAIEREYDKGLCYLKDVGWELPAGVRTTQSNRHPDCVRTK